MSRKLKSREKRLCGRSFHIEGMVSAKAPKSVMREWMRSSRGKYGLERKSKE